MLKFALAGLIVAGSVSAVAAMPLAKPTVGGPQVEKTVVVVKKVVRRRPAAVVIKKKPPVVVKKTIVR